MYLTLLVLCIAALPLAWQIVRVALILLSVLIFGA